MALAVTPLKRLLRAIRQLMLVERLGTLNENLIGELIRVKGHVLTDADSLPNRPTYGDKEAWLIAKNRNSGRDLV